MVSLGAHPTGTSTVATGVSADGSVVVGRGGGNRAFIWTQPTGMMDLTAYFLSLGVTQVAGWSFVSDLDVSDDGRVITGTGINPSGGAEGFYAVIPAPAPLAAFLLAGLAASRRRRR
jgi:probable HAF family extracellular repeat protein